eukprot:403369397
MKQSNSSDEQYMGYIKQNKYRQEQKSNDNREIDQQMSDYYMKLSNFENSEHIRLPLKQIEEDDDYFQEDESMKDFNYDQDGDGVINNGVGGDSANSNIVNQNLNNNLISVNQVDDSLMAFDNPANNDVVMPYHGDEYTDFKQQSSEMYQPAPQYYDNQNLYDRYNSNRSLESNYRDQNFGISHISSPYSSNTMNFNNYQSNNNPLPEQIQQQNTIESSNPSQSYTQEYEQNNQIQRLSSIGTSINQVNANNNSQVSVAISDDVMNKVDINMANAIMNNESSKSQALSGISSTTQQNQNQDIQKLSNISEEQDLLQQMTQEVRQEQIESDIQLQEMQLEELKKQIASDKQDQLLFNQLHQQTPQTQYSSLTDNQDISYKQSHQVQLPDMYEQQLTLLNKIKNNEYSPTSTPDQTSFQPIPHKQRHNSEIINKHQQDSAQKLVQQQNPAQPKQGKFVTYYKSIDEAKKLALYASLELDHNNHQKALEYLRKGLASLESNCVGQLQRQN